MENIIDESKNDQVNSIENQESIENTATDEQSILDETTTTTKGFRVTLATKKRIAKIESATSLSGDDLVRQLLDAYDILNYKEDETSDEFEELKSILSRIQSIFLNSRERLDTQNSIVSNRLKETIKNLNTKLEALSVELKNTKEHYENEIQNLKDSYIIDKATIEKEIREKDDKIRELNSELKDKKVELEDNKAKLKDIQDKLSEQTINQTTTSNLLEEKDTLISELTSENKELNERLSSERDKVNNLTKKNNAILNEVQKYKIKYDSLKELKDQQKKLYEETLAIYKTPKEE